MFTPALRGAFEPPLRGPLDPGTSTPIQRAIALLRRFGSDAHLWLPGIGSVNGLTAGNYLLSDASTGLAPVDQVVGRVNDALGGLGEELLTGVWAANPGKSTITNIGGVLSVTNTGGDAYASAYQSFTTVVGATYKLGVTQLSGNAITRIGVGIGSPSIGATLTTLSSVTTTFVATGTTTYISPTVNSVTVGATATFYIDNISVREVTGIHATQATTANKPIERRGLVNLLTYSGDFTNGAWSKANVTPTAGFTDPDGGLGATRAVGLYGGAMYESVAVSPNTTYTFIFKAKNNGGGNASYAVYNNTGNSFILSATSYLAAISSWSDVVVQFTTPAGCSNIRVYPVSSASATDVLLYKTALFQGTYTAAEIQAQGGIPITTSAAASSSVGKYNWSFDGSNDSLALGSVPFQMSDDFAVITAVKRTGSTATWTTHFSISDATASKWIFNMTFDNTGSPYISAMNDAESQSLAQGGSNMNGIAFVHSGVKTGGGSPILKNRVNGVQLSSNAAPGSYALGATRADIGCCGVSSFSNGNIGPVIAIKGTVTDSELLLLEKFVGALSGVSI